MAHNIYHNTVYDINQDPMSVGDILSTGEDSGFDFTGSEYEQFFSPYDPTEENFARQSSALQQDYQNTVLMQGARNQLQQMNRPQFRGFTGTTGGAERDLRNFRKNLQTGYNQQMSFNQARADLDLQRNIFGTRKDFEEDTRQRLIDLIRSGANLDEYNLGKTGVKLPFGSGRTFYVDKNSNSNQNTMQETTVNPDIDYYDSLYG